MTQDKINRINELAHKENLTDEEKADRLLSGTSTARALSAI